MPGALEGVRVIEIGSAIAGPLCTALLADMGADVIKIENPGKGDDARAWGEQVSGESPYFIYYNRNKKSIEVNLKSEEGKNFLSSLIKESDVLVENLRPGTMKRLGFGYEDVRRINEGIIYCSVSGFGQTGPYRELGGYDAIIQAMCGVMAVTGEKDGRPLRVGFPVTDIAAAMYAAFSIVTALYYRERTGKGQMIDVSLFESGVSLVGQWITISMLTGKKISRFGNSYPLLFPYEVFNAKDREIVVAVGNDELWQKLCRIIGREDIARDERFKTNPQRIMEENRKFLYKILQDELIKREAKEWLSEMRKEGIPCSLIASIEELIDDPQLRERGVFVKAKHKKLGEITHLFALPKFSLTEPRLRYSAPTIGENNDEFKKKHS